MSVTLKFAERRVLGVLIEKGFTTPQQYPLTINALLTGCNQQSCRDPISQLTESLVFDALDSLRERGLVTLVRTTGGRTDRYKHNAGGTFDLAGAEMAVLAELLLRGPQTDGELRQRASRMVPIGDLAMLGEILEKLQGGDEPLVRRLSPPQRKRGVKYAHRLYPPHEEPSEEEAEDELSPGSPTGEPQEMAEPAKGKARAAPTQVEPDRLLQLVDLLERRLEDLEDRIERIEARCPELTGSAEDSSKSSESEYEESI